MNCYLFYYIWCIFAQPRSFLNCSLFYYVWCIFAQPPNVRFPFPLKMFFPHHGMLSILVTALLLYIRLTLQIQYCTVLNGMNLLQPRFISNTVSDSFYALQYRVPPPPRQFCQWGTLMLLYPP